MLGRSGQRRLSTMQLAIATVAGMGGGLFALSCSKGGDQRYSSTGTGIDAGGNIIFAGGAASGGGGSGTGTSTPTPVPSSGSSSLVDADVATEPPTAYRCAELGRAWIPESGSTSARCGDVLVNWCCTRNGVFSHFPADAEALQEHTFSTLVDGEGLSLYACSTDAAGKVTLHFARGEAKTDYQAVTLADSPVTFDEEPAEACVADAR